MIRHVACAQQYQEPAWARRAFFVHPVSLQTAKPEPLRKVRLREVLADDPDRRLICKAMSVSCQSLFLDRDVGWMK